MDLGIEGTVAVVMGAGGGLGGAIAKSLAAEGVAIAACDIDEAAAKRLCETLCAAGHQAHAFKLDLNQLDSFEGVVASIKDQLGPASILINNSGGPPPTAAAGVELELWRKHFESMVLSLIRFTDLVLPDMRERKWGRIITSTSSGVIAPIPNLAISNALRMSLVGWSKTLAAEVAAEGITVNVVLPGRISTDRIRFLDEARAKREGKTLADVEAESTGSIPVRRYGRPEEYGDVVALLASRNASFITGSTIRVDGGMITSL
jgi:3-oxoacyl-[acyl-carrier protein] reductase